MTLRQRVQVELDRFRTWFGENRAPRENIAEAGLDAPAPTRPAMAALKWGGAALAVIILLILVFFDWNMLRGPLSRYASGRLHRQVRIEGNLHVHLWSWTPRVDVGGLHIANTKWAGGGDMADVGHLTVTVRLLPLLRGKTVFPLVQLDRSSFLYVRNLAGRSNWQFSKTVSNRPLKLPPINRFLINDGKLRLYDARKKMRFAGIVNSSESTNGRGKGFSLIGDGTLNGERFTADVHGAPLLNVDQSRPYPFSMDVHAGYTHITASGQIDRPFDLGALHLTVASSGRDAADLYYLTGLVLPNTPPYRATAQIVRDGEIFRVTDISGHLGRSDVTGVATIDASGDIPLLEGDLRSRSVYFNDLGFLFGSRVAARAPAVTRAAAASSPGITLAAPKGAAVQKTLLLPDAPLDVERVRQMNADVRYRATSIISSDFPLHSIRVHLRLNAGVLRLDPLDASLAQGTVSGRVKLDASRRVPVTTLDLRVRDIKLQQLVHPVRGQPTIEGPLEARAQIVAAGDSVHRAASNADGSLIFVVPRGEMRKAFAELLGINLLNGGLALLTGDQTQTNVRCAIASFQASKGVFNASNIVLDTDVERGGGRGSIDMKTETINFILTGEAKSFRLLRMNAPITITGSLSHPKIGVQASRALGQGGLVVALGALINPLASLLATIDPGLAKDANCGAVLAQAKEKGAPVSRRALQNVARTPLRTVPTSERVVRRR